MGIKGFYPRFTSNLGGKLSIENILNAKSREMHTGIKS